MKTILPVTRGVPVACFAVTAALALALAAPAPSLRADTQYWNRTTTGLVWASSSNANWAASEDGTTYATWGSGNDAVIVTPSAAIAMGGSYVSASGLVIRNGATLTHTGSGSGGNTGLRITGANGSSGGGNLTLSENTDSTASLRVFLASHVAGSVGYNGTITVNSFSNANSGLYLGADSKDAAAGAAYTGTDTNTRVVLTGGALFLNGGLADNVATVGSLSGSGRVVLGNVFSSNSGTRTLRVEQAADTVFTGDIGGLTTTQTNNTLALTKAGAGSLTLRASDASGYAGTTTVGQGTLRLIGTFGSSNVSGGAVNQGDFVVKSGATLGLDGTFNLGGAKTVTIKEGGILDAGRMTLDGAGTTTGRGLVFEGEATIRFALGSRETGSLITLVDASMRGQSGGAADSILFSFTNAGDAQAGERYDLIRFGADASASIVLTEYALSQESIAAGWAGTFGYSADGRTLQFLVTAAGSAIPEPGAAALLLGGAALGLLAMKNRIR
ncbi:MAG: autotransporter-associated beta strand repeat-containing protein [Opitutaceae bacterium]|jgi:autotransporter-associated beta strand protein|nr:autotransporter-associated beta strand repeat-containing protein [Opitutaceae bacterium]